jgi:peptidoglycan/xylan/chitin deacetylase (PgdA/CDA1 family)
MLKTTLRKIGYITLSNSWRVKSRLENLHSSNLLTVLNLHRVSPNQNSTFKPMKPHLFEKLIVFCKKKFNIVTFSELKDLAETAKKLDRPNLIISFDDGYKDFIEYTMPILHKHQVKVNQNIIPSCVESGFPPFNVLIQDFIAQAPTNILNKFSIPDFKINNSAERAHLGFLISKHLKNRSEHSRLLMMEEILPQIQAFQDIKNVQMMDVRDLQECSGSHEIGIHSFTHASMNYETDQFFEKDVITCKKWCLQYLGYDPKIYAFPNGSYKKSQIPILEHHKFSHILLVNNSFSSPFNVLHNRIKYHANSEQEMIFRALGGLQTLDGTPH